MTAFFAACGDVLAAPPIPPPPDDPIGTSAATTACGSSNFPGFTRRIVQCVRDTVIAATDLILQQMVTFLTPVLAGAFTLSVGIWGFLAATGRAQWVLPKGSALLIKMGVVATLFGATTYNFQYFYEGALSGVDELLDTSTSIIGQLASYSGTCDPPPNDPKTMMVWNNIDCLLDILIGDVIPNSSVFLGLGGFFMALILTDAIGVFIGLLGFLLIAILMLAILRALYIFTLSYLAISIMFLVAPIFIPAMLFQNTRGYFEKWVKLTIGFILQPVFLFVYLSMLLAAFDSVVYTGSNSLYNAITGNLYNPGCDTSGGGGSGSASCPIIGVWLAGQGAYTDKEKGNIAVNVDATNSQVGTGNNPPSSLTIQPIETGVTDEIGELPTIQSAWNDVLDGVAQNIHQALGIDQYFFQINMPMEVVDWDCLAEKASGASNCANVPSSNKQNYIIDLVLAVIMAVVTAYIFMLLLDRLPFVGSGLATGGLFGGSSFGFGSLAPPGANFVDGIKKKVMG